MMQTVVIRRSGYPVRRLYEDFCTRYQPLLASIYTKVAKDKVTLYLTKNGMNIFTDNVIETLYTEYTLPMFEVINCYS